MNVKDFISYLVSLWSDIVFLLARFIVEMLLPSWWCFWFSVKSVVSVCNFTGNPSRVFSNPPITNLTVYFYNLNYIVVKQEENVAKI